MEELNERVNEITKSLLNESRCTKVTTPRSSESMTSQEKKAFMKKYAMKKPFDPESILQKMDMFTFQD